MALQHHHGIHTVRSGSPRTSADQIEPEIRSESSPSIAPQAMDISRDEAGPSGEATSWRGLCGQLDTCAGSWLTSAWACFVKEEEPDFTLSMLSSRQLRQLKWAFDTLDEDDSGFIQGNELESVVQLLGDNPSRSEAGDLLAWLDRDHDGKVSLEEFARAWWKRPAGLVSIKEQQEELELAFRLFDTDKSGTISREELTNVFTTMGERFNEEEMDEFIGWLGMRHGEQMSLGRFKQLPCWYAGELHQVVGSGSEGGFASGHRDTMSVRENSLSITGGGKSNGVGEQDDLARYPQSEC